MNRLFLIILMLLPVLAIASDFKVKIADANGNTFHNSQVFTGCGGGNVSPEVVWSGAPKGTKSFALTVYDPDAPTGSGWWHWVVTDIPPSANKLAKGAGNDKSKLPSGAVESRTDFGRPGYGGPCPPAGKPHRYVFTVYALKVGSLNINPDSSGASAGFAIKANMIGHTSTTLKYGR